VTVAALESNRRRRATSQWWAVAVVTTALATCASGPLEAGALTSEVNGLRVELTSRPGRPVASGQTEYVVRLTNHAGHPVDGARLTLRGTMADGMSIVAPIRSGEEPGVYRGRVLFTMEGRWELTLRIARGGKRFELPITEHVGR
jgi:hypothetical protein